MNFDDYEPVPGFEFDPDKTIMFRPKQGVTHPVRVRRPIVLKK